MSGPTSTYGINGSTKILDNNETAKVSDMEVGDRVIVIPSESDKTVAAQIIINPGMVGPGGERGTPPGGTSTPNM